MLITCPSCSRTHDSAKYRDAFEIECDCGYSILVPDEEAIAKDNSNTPGFQSPPIAMDEEDNELAIDISGTNVVTEDQNNPFAPFDGATDMTPEDELPTGMIYDPDEAQALADSKNEWSKSDQEKESFLDPFELPSETSQEDPTAQIQTHENPSIPDLPEVESPAQTLLQQNQSASLGHLVGSEYDINFSKLDESQLLKMTSRCEELLLANPWLKQLVESLNSKCSPENFVKHKKIERVPEILALELFLYCYEIGGQCSFVPAESLELHSP